MSELRKLIDHLEHIEQGGELIRELDAKTGRVVSKPALSTGGKKWPTTDAEIRAFQQANPPLKVDGLIGQQTLARLQQSGYVPPAGFKPVANKAATPGAAPQGAPMPSAAGGNTSDFSNDTAVPGLSGSKIAGQNADGSFNSDHPFVLAMNKKTAAQKNPNGNNGHDGSGIEPNADPADPKTWPPGVKPAPDFGYLDSEGMWIPTPFDVRTEEGKWRKPRSSPANTIGIMVKNNTPFQQKVQQMQDKVVYLSSSAIEQVKPMNLPNGAPTIPGYKQIDASRFSQDAREPGLNKTIPWVYAYQNGKNFILISPMLFYNTKLSIGRHYSTWGTGSLRSDDDRVPSANGPVYVSAKDFNVNDTILDVVVHVSVGAPNIGPQVLQSIKI